MNLNKFSEVQKFSLTLFKDLGSETCPLHDNKCTNHGECQRGGVCVCDKNFLGNACHINVVEL